MDDLHVKVRELVERSAAPVTTEEAIGRAGHSPGAGRWTLVAAIVVLVSLVGGLAALAASNTGHDEAPAAGDDNPTPALDYAIDVVNGRNSGGGVSYADRLSDLLPNTLVLGEEGGAWRPLTDLVVIGHITAVEPGTAWVLPDDPALEDGPNDGQTQVPFDADAAWRTVHATITVERSLTPGLEPSEVTAGISIGGGVDVDLFSQGLVDLGRAVFFLDADSAVFSYDPNLYAIGANGSLVATIADNGALALPFADGGEFDVPVEMLAGTPDLASLLAAGQGPGRLIDATATPIRYFERDRVEVSGDPPEECIISPAGTEPVLRDHLRASGLTLHHIRSFESDDASYENLFFISAEVDGTGFEDDGDIATWASNGGGWGTIVGRDPDEPPVLSPFASLVPVNGIAQAISSGVGELRVPSMDTDGAVESQSCAASAVDTLTVPDVVGLSEVRAANLLSGLGFEVAMFEEADPVAAEGEVIRQDPPAGRTAQMSTVVTIIISAGPPSGDEPVTVPSVAGLPADEAIATIRGVGLHPTIEIQELPPGDVADGIVISQSVAPGSPVDVGAIVVLHVGFVPD